MKKAGHSGMENVFNSFYEVTFVIWIFSNVELVQIFIDVSVSW